MDEQEHHEDQGRQPMCHFEELVEFVPVFEVSPTSWNSPLHARTTDLIQGMDMNVSQPCAIRATTPVQ